MPYSQKYTPPCCFFCKFAAWEKSSITPEYIDRHFLRRKSTRKKKRQIRVHTFYKNYFIRTYETKKMDKKSKSNAKKQC